MISEGFKIYGGLSTSTVHTMYVSLRTQCALPALHGSLTLSWQALRLVKSVVLVTMPLFSD